MIEPLDILNAQILIVDDQEANIDLLTQMLNESGYKQVTATMKPQEVCALHRKHHYDLILLDLQMPDMDGFQVMEGLKTNHADAYLPVIVLTAQPGHKLRALQAGAKDFISKPFDFVEIKTRIYNMLVVRFLYKKLENYNKLLEQTVLERTAELRESEARYRSLTELASDWYWEQDENMKFTKVSGPVLEMLGIQVDSLVEELATEKQVDAKSDAKSDASHSESNHANSNLNNTFNNTLNNKQNGSQKNVWNKQERALLQAKISAREPFLDFIFSRENADGTQQKFQVSGEPMFNLHCHFIGYRGIGVELTSRK